MDTRNFLINISKVTMWPIVTLILGSRIIDLFSPKTVQSSGIYFNLPLNINWDSVIAIGTIITAITAFIALILTYKTGVFDKTPNVLASGTFVISTKNKNTNTVRDEAIDKNNSIHTLQLINVGRGLAKNIIPSRIKNVKGEFLEDVCPHSFVLPSSKSTKDLSETLRVHGQIFVWENHKLEFEENRTTAYFYINFEDHSGKAYITKVKINKVEHADGKVEELRTTPGIEIWKVMNNIKEGI